MKRSLVLSIFFSISLISAISADDTDIFFSQQEGNTNTYPNFIFILDNSGSMRGTGVGGTQSKMAELKEAMHKIIDSSENINLGIMHFLGWQDRHHSRLSVPVLPINEPGAKQLLKDAVDSLGPDHNTPLVGALYEAAMVFRGGSIEDSSANYTSPMLGECQNNHIVMLSDGQPWQNPAINKTQRLIGRRCVSPPYAPGNWFGSMSAKCGVELSGWLESSDHAPGLSRKQNVTVSTIGFNISSTFLQDVASAGGGNYYEANRADELVDAFNQIITTVKDIDTTFVAPATSINQFNRLTQSNDLFFSMFKPDTKATWAGNLKRYKLGYMNGNVVIQDANGNAAVDNTTGLFRDSSRSIWSNVIDGNSVHLGGAAEKIDSDSRRIYTHIGSIPNGGINLTNIIDEGNDTIASMLRRLPSQTRQDFIKWVNGKDVQRGLNGLITSQVERRHIGSVLHSTPVTVTYSGGKSLVFVGTNEGLLHAIDKNTGREDFSFLPQDLILDLLKFYENSGSRNRPHGLDGDISFYHSDRNGNSIVDPGDRAYLYFGMRRGGRDYYAMDITNPRAPRLMWQIRGGRDAFSRLGQTWSKPIPTKIQYNGRERHVLIFGGGYIDNHDSRKDGGRPDTDSRDQYGNTIYIVDAMNGTKIWDAYEHIRNVSGHMRYAIPSNLRIIDVNGDQFADRIYVGDMGGQIWRFDIKPYHQSSDGIRNLVDGGRLANLRAGSNRIRFYNEPDVALMSHKGERFMSVSIGSGWRANPLDDIVNDRFYMIRDNHPLTKPEGYGKRSGRSFIPVVEQDLENVTNSLNSDRDDEVDVDGWMILLTDQGEKNLSKSITVNNQVIFSTYAPVAATDACSPGSGRAYIYAMDAATGNPVLPLNGGGGAGNLSTRDRKKILKSESIPPPPSAAIVDVGGKIRTTIMTGLETPLNDLPFSDLTQRTYWHDRRRGSASPAECRASSGAAC